MTQVKQALSYKWPARLIGILSITLAVYVHVYVSEYSPFLPATLCSFAVAALCCTWKKQLVKLYSRPVWLEDLQSHTDPDVSTKSVKMFAWFMVICAAVSAGVCIENLSNLVDVLGKKTVFETIALIGGIISAYQSTLRVLGSLALGLVKRMHNSSDTMDTELKPASNLIQGPGTVQDTCDRLDDCNVTEDIVTHCEILQASGKYIKNETFKDVDCGCAVVTSAKQ